MPNNEEQRLDLIKNCDLLLNGILASFEQTDNTPEGRMITQLKWLKERAENHDLPLPVDPDKLATIRYVYTDGELCRHASNPRDKKSVDDEVETPMSNILSIAKHGRLLYKPEYEAYVLICIDSLLDLLTNAKRPLDQYEQGLIIELRSIKSKLKEKKITPPLGTPLPEYPNFRKVFRINKSSIDDLANGKKLTRLINDTLFNGIRPDSWLTLESADAAINQYLV